MTVHDESGSRELVPIDPAPVVAAAPAPAGWYEVEGRLQWWNGLAWDAVYQPSPQHVRAAFAAVAVTERWIHFGAESQPVAGVTAVVESAGQLHQRSTLARTAVGGLLLGPVGLVVGSNLKKRMDHRELYLLIDGPHYAWLVPVDPRWGAEARRFAAYVTTMSKWAAAGGMPR